MNCLQKKNLQAKNPSGLTLLVNYMCPLSHKLSCPVCSKQLQKTVISQEPVRKCPLRVYAYLRGIKNKKMEGTFYINNVKIPPDSEHRETFEAPILACFPFTGVRLEPEFLTAGIQQSAELTSTFVC